jgi:cell wall-associated NlpC family hydrolase
MAEELRIGDLLLVQGEGFVDDFIRFAQRVKCFGWRFAIAHWGVKELCPEDPTSVSHVAVYVGNGNVIEALAKGLTLSPVTKYPEDSYLPGYLVEAVPFTEGTERLALADFAREQLERHDKYGWLSIMSLVIQTLTPEGLDVSWDGALICSAFGSQCWEHAGFTLTTRSSLTTYPYNLAIMAGYKLVRI